MEAMPCRSEGAKAALKEIIQQGLYVFNPLPATDIEAEPILPIQYKLKLSGATVLATFSLACERFQKGWQFYADIHAITILSKPPNVVEPLTSTTATMSSRFQVPEVAQKRARLDKL